MQFVLGYLMLKQNNIDNNFSQLAKAKLEWIYYLEKHIYAGDLFHLHLCN